MITHARTGLRIFFSSLKLRNGRYKRYTGDAKEICCQIVDDCFNGNYFRASTTNFNEFWTRDFGWCTQFLLKDHKKEVHSTIEYALNAFRKSRLTTTISPNGRPYDVFTYSPDSLAWLLHSICISGFEITQYKKFLAKEVRRFIRIAYDNNLGLIKRNKHFSSIKDYAIRSSSTYDNVMLWMIAEYCSKLNIRCSLNQAQIKKNVFRHLWNGRYFYDDMNKHDYVAGDAQVFPFFCGMFKDKRMLTCALNACMKNGLDSPLPLKYTKIKTHMSYEELIVPGYEQNTCWLHIGPLFIHLLEKIDKKKAREHRERLFDTIEKYKTFPEVLNPDLTPYKSWYYHCAMGMLWASMVL